MKVAIVQLVVAVAAAAGSVVSWLASMSTVDVPSIIEGEPMTISTVYSPPLLSLSLLLATVAGVLAVLGVARMRRTNRRQQDPGSLVSGDGPAGVGVVEP